MKRKFSVNILYMLFVLCSCSNSDDPSAIGTTVLVREGESKSIQINGNNLSISLVSVKALFSEGLYHDNGGQLEGEFITVFDAIVKFNDQPIDFRTTSEYDTKDNKIEKDWTRLEKSPQGIKSFESYQVGISHLYPENGISAQDRGKYIIKLLIK